MVLVILGTSFILGTVMLGILIVGALGSVIDGMLMAGAFGKVMDGMAIVGAATDGILPLLNSATHTTVGFSKKVIGAPVMGLQYATLAQPLLVAFTVPLAIFGKSFKISLGIGGSAISIPAHPYSQ